MSELDTRVIGEYLDNALAHGDAGNDWGEGYWIGRAVQHGQQNAVDEWWLAAELAKRGLDVGAITEQSDRLHV